MAVNAKQVGAVMLVGVMSVAVGCASTPGSDAGAESAEAQLMNDTLIERKLRRQFSQTPDLVNEQIIVGSVAGEVTLGGTVRSSIEREVAEQVARGIDGVMKVTNNITTRN